MANDADNHRPEPPPLAGLGGFAARIGLGTALAIVVAALAFRLIEHPASKLTDAARSQEGLTHVATPAGQGPSSVVPAIVSDSAGVGPIAQEIERRHAAGELSEAQRRFDPCPGGDLRRVAWIDHLQHVLKITRQTASGALVEEWFDDAGHLREAALRMTAAGHPWRRRVVLDERGHETVVESTDGLAPEEPLPAVHTADPVEAFFSGAGCAAR